MALTLLVSLRGSLRLIIFGGLSIDVDTLRNAGHLPRDFHLRLIGSDLELIVLDLAGDDCLRELSDDGELIAEVAVMQFKIIRQVDSRFAVRIRCDVAVADVRRAD